MSKFSKLGLRRAAGAVAVAAAAVVGITSMGAGAASAQKLADGYKNVQGFDDSVQVWRKGETGGALPTVANNPLSRGVYLSGVYSAKGSAGVTGTLQLGYIIGCQVNISGLSATLGGALNIVSPALSSSASISLPITPGEVAVVNDVYDTDITDKGANLQISNFQVELPKCGGYAAARSFVKVIAAKGYSPKDGTLNADGTVLQTTLYGQPFNVS